MNWPSHSFHLVAKRIGPPSQQQDPANSADSIHDQEVRTAHAVGIGEHGDKYSQGVNKSPEENDLAAMSKEIY